MRDRTPARFRPNLLELERRDVPAWWAVTLPETPAGTLGDTAAAHSGGLTWAAGYAPDQDGQVRVYADTIEDAVALAVTGQITVTHAGGPQYAHAFGPETVGTSANERKPFLVEADGGVVTIAFEDMAGLADSDWDYNDRTWGVRAADASGLGGGVEFARAAGGGVTSGGHDQGSGTASDPWILDDSNTGESARVSLSVTPEGADHLRWTYTVTNATLSYQMASLTPGMNRFSLGGAVTHEVDDMRSSIGWTPSLDAGVISWQTPSVYAGPYMVPGDTHTFSFRTPPQPRVTGGGEVGMAGHPEFDPDTGTYSLLVVPALRPMNVKIQVPGPKPTVTIQQIDHVIINANDDNWNPAGANMALGNPINNQGQKRWVSDAQRYIPTKRDFSATNLWQDDPDLVPVTITVSSSVAGVITLEEYAPGEGKIDFWLDKKKNNPVSVLQVPADQGSTSFTVFVEGVHPSADYDDVAIMSKFRAAGQNAVLATDTEPLSVGPFVRSFDVALAPVRFINNLDGRQGLELGNFAAGQAGATFQVTIAYYGLPVGFLQNVRDVQNGANGTAAGAVFIPGNANKNLIPNPNLGIVLPGAVLDTALDNGDPRFPSSAPVAINPKEVKIEAKDNPTLGVAFADGPKILSYDIRKIFRMYIIIQLRGGALYSLGEVDWGVNFFANRTANATNPWADKIDPTSNAMHPPPEHHITSRSREDSWSHYKQ